MGDTPEELANRNENAALLRYVEMMRRHGHRAAKVCRAEVAIGRSLDVAGEVTDARSTHWT